MQVHFGLGALCAEWPESVVCVGTFDGVHRGHRQVIGKAVGEARDREMPCVLVTFDRHPAAVLAPDRCPFALSSLEQNIRIFESLGVSVSVILPFDEALSQLSAETFLDTILISRLKAGSVVIGHDFAMGHNREGDANWLAGHIETTVVAPYTIDGRRVSSSEIRELVKKGEVEAAATLLGRSYELSGVVVQGQKLGRQLGYPTANIARSMEQLLPGDGIYAGTFSFQSGAYNAAISIGLRPAVGGSTRTVEAYLLDYPGDSLYGCPCHLGFTQRIREECDFESLEALSEQIALDVQQVRTMATS
jgi:riboflavin kinase/FMN adenylyltransferase